MFKRKKQEVVDPLVRKLAELYWLKGFARIINIVTLLASAGGNVLHARKTPIGVTLSLLAPIFLMFAFEMLSRTPVRKGGPSVLIWMLVRVGATLGIAGGTAWISYFHQRDGIFAETGDLMLAMLLPAITDFLMIVSAGTLIEVHIQIRMWEATQVSSKKAERVATIDAPPKEKKPGEDKAAKIAQIWARSPQLSVKEIASLAGTSYNYAHKVISKMKEAVDTPDAEVALA